MTSIVKIEALDTNQYYLSFDVNDIKHSKDGHTWALLIQTYCRNKKINLGDVTHDPESDLYAAIASTKESLEKISSVIQVLISDHYLFEKTLQKVNELDDYHDEDDMTTEEFLEWMSEAGYDMSKPKTFDFLLDNLINPEQAKLIENEIKAKRYKTRVDVSDPDDIFFQIKVSVKPSLDLVLEIEEYLESIALKYGVRYIGCGI